MRIKTGNGSCINSGQVINIINMMMLQSSYRIMTSMRMSETVQHLFYGLPNKVSMDRVQNKQEVGLHLMDGLFFLLRLYVSVLISYTGCKRAWTSSSRRNSMEVYCTTTSRLGSFLASSNGREFIERVLGEASPMFVHSSPIASAYGHCCRQYNILALVLTLCSCFYVLTISDVAIPHCV